MIREGVPTLIREGVPTLIREGVPLPRSEGEGGSHQISASRLARSAAGWASSLKAAVAVPSARGSWVVTP